MTKKVAILQSNYIPWKGYFDIINSVDEFILYDEVQFTKQDWRNRNLIKSSQGLQWLSIPVQHSKKSHQTILDTQVSGINWGKKHWHSLSMNYSKSAFFGSYREIFAELYLGSSECKLSQINYRFLTAINQILDINTKISWSTDYQSLHGKSERLLGLCQACGAQEYISGPAAKNYLDEQLFTDNGIKISWMDYSDYPEYRQLYPPFQHQVSILDLIFNEGLSARAFMKSFRSRQPV